MSLRRETPCDFGECPYNATYSYTCEFYCSAEEPEDYPEIWDDDEEWDYQPHFSGRPNCQTICKYF